jgi:MFS family permease
MGVPPSQQGVIFSCANAGLAVGALSFGLLVDIIGRKWAFNLTCLITSVFGLLLAAPKYNYGAICGIYFLASLGLGGNIPIDATIALEFLPQNRRYLVPLLSLWQPVGVVAASGIAYGTAAKYRCGDGDTSLLSCRSPELAAGAPCCSVSSNMGWRYTVIVIGGATLLVFFLRYFVFTFYESPKFLISRGQYDDAIEVLHKIAKFNKAPPPTLTADDLRAVDHADGVFDAERPKALHRKMTFKEKVKHALRLDTAKHVIRNFAHSFGHLKLLAKNKLQMFIFGLLAIAYMGDYW